MEIQRTPWRLLPLSQGVVTDHAGDADAQALYDQPYCARGDMESQIKLKKNSLIGLMDAPFQMPNSRICGWFGA